MVCLFTYYQKMMLSIKIILFAKKERKIVINLYNLTIFLYYSLYKWNKGVYIMINKTEKGVKTMKYIPPEFKTLTNMAAIDVGRLTEE